MQVYYCEGIMLDAKVWLGFAREPFSEAAAAPQVRLLSERGGPQPWGRVRYKHWRARAVRYDSRIFLMA
jgi:hypothetical protein